jgi:lipopolysaccharide/colanic/teichoic acid biosynthesis glycosyltransferase
MVFVTDSRKQFAKETTIMSRRTVYAHIKRWIDVVVAGSLLILFFPLILFVALLIRLDSSGPVFFRQTRIGHKQQPFIMYKFRTMQEGAALRKQDLMHLNRAAFPAFKVPNDPRLTRVGRYLRKIHLDEIPNLVNVLRGEMSLVGFRPPTPDELPHYKPWHFRRFRGVPGITSLWVVHHYHCCSFDNWIRLDIYYNQHLSFCLDLCIMLRTVLCVFTAHP